MLIVHPVGQGVVAYYTDGRDPGDWTPGAARLLGLAGPVDPADLRAVLGGRHPASGQFLPAVRSGRRRAGWDLIFSAPKSVSLLARGPAGADVEAAHRAAVGGILERLESRLTVYRRAPSGHRLPAAGLVGARFEHRANAGGEPHVHTHVLVANLSRSANGWSAIRNDDWFIGRRSLAALYQMALRHELTLRGWQLDWRMRDDGLADVASVPRAAIRAVSTSGRTVGPADPAEAGHQARSRPWPARAAEAGWGGSAGPAGPAAAPTGRPPALGNPALPGQVTGRLAVRRSDFGINDVIVALASRLPAGAPVAEAADWAERFCATGLPVPSATAGARWTTSMARTADDRLARLLDELAARPGPDPGRQGILPAGTGTVTVLGCPAGQSDLIAQAALIRRGLDQAGISAAVAAPTGPAATRWGVLTGLPAYHPGRRAQVLVVDQADRRGTGELLRLAEAARAWSARLVLIEGGTLPRLTNFASHGLARFAARSGTLTCPRPAPWTASRADGPANEILSRWLESDHRALLVGLGLEEVRGLNEAARRLATGTAQPHREAGLGPADRVVVLRGGDHRRPYASLGRITGMEPDAGRVAIQWDGSPRPETYGSQVLAGLGPGWAVTPHLAARAGRPVMLLGPASAAPRLRPLLRASIEPEPAGRERSAGLGR